MEETKVINGVEFTRPRGNTIRKLGDLSQGVVYVVTAKETRPTKFGSFVVTVIKKDDYTEEKVYMPHYVAEYAEPGKLFTYAGLQKKSNGSGHSFHDVMWASDERLV